MVLAVTFCTLRKSEFAAVVGVGLFSLFFLVIPSRVMRRLRHHCHLSDSTPGLSRRRDVRLNRGRSGGVWGGWGGSTEVCWRCEGWGTRLNLTTCSRHTGPVRPEYQEAPFHRRHFVVTGNFGWRNDRLHREKQFLGTIFHTCKQFVFIVSTTLLAGGNNLYRQ